MKKTIVALTVALGLVIPVVASAQRDMRTEQVRFAAGTSGTTINDSITGYESVLYKVGAEAGQQMQVRLEPSNTAAYFNVYAPGRGPGDEALVNSQFMGPKVPELNIFDGALPASGEYTVSVYMMRSAARREETSNYTITISIEGDTGTTVQGDFADGLQGGPDFYQVSTSGGGSLNLRENPSSGAGVVMRLNNGQNVRNFGCRMAEGRRWCRVATLVDPGSEGWAAGDFLVEGRNDPSAGTNNSASSATATSGDSTSTVTVRFPAGSTGTELTGALAPGESRRYVLGAANGQNLDVRVAARGPDMSYQIFNPDNTFLLEQITSAQEYRGQLWQSGDHVIEVINRGRSTTSYNMIVGDRMRSGIGERVMPFLLLLFRMSFLFAVLLCVAAAGLVTASLFIVDRAPTSIQFLTISVIVSGILLVLGLLLFGIQSNLSKILGWMQSLESQDVSTPAYHVSRLLVYLSCIGVGLCFVLGVLTYAILARIDQGFAVFG